MFAKHSPGPVSLMMACVAAFVAVSAPALADPVTLTSTVQLDKVVTANGVATHTLVDPVADHDKVVPGNHLVFTTTYRNAGAKPIEHFVVTNPLPAAVVLASDGFGGFDVSVDKGQSWGKLEALTVSDGKGGKRPAEATDVTTLRWVIPLIAPGASGTLEYHAVVR